MRRVLACSIACLLFKSFACDNCCEINSRRLPRYKLIKSNARSNQFILASAVVRTASECRKFASTKRALAFNYGSEIKRHGSSFTLACVPRAGMFVFSSNNLNYSQAQDACQKMNASLAHIISEERTNGLAKYISLDTPALVGLARRDNEKFWTNEFDETLSCFNYRAWGEGEPARSKGCVGLVQPTKSRPGPFWKVVPCDAALPFICEISPTYR